jgi:transposase-like protein
VFT